MTPLHRRPDGTFVVNLGGLPYHVTASDPLFPVASAAAAGLDLPPEPTPPAVVLPEVREPTRAELLAELQALRARIDALPG